MRGVDGFCSIKKFHAAGAVKRHEHAHQYVQAVVARLFKPAAGRIKQARQGDPCASPPYLLGQFLVFQKMLAFVKAPQGLRKKRVSIKIPDRRWLY
jgi:hypothetical protein